MNRGLKLLYCKECGKKRYCSSEPIPGYNFRKTCSRGHSWVLVGITLERANAAVKDLFNKEKLRGLFDRDDIFFANLKGR